MLNIMMRRLGVGFSSSCKLAAQADEEGECSAGGLGIPGSISL